MTEMSPRHRRTAARPQQAPQSQRMAGEMPAGAVLDGETAALLAELGLPPHFLEDVDIDILGHDSWDHIPDLDDDLEKGAKETAFNFDWSWLQQDLKNPGMAQQAKPAISRTDWRSPPAPSMVRPGLAASRMPERPELRPELRIAAPPPEQQPQNAAPIEIIPPPVVVSASDTTQTAQASTLPAVTIPVTIFLADPISPSDNVVEISRVPSLPTLIETMATDTALTLWDAPLSVAAPATVDGATKRKQNISKQKTQAIADRLVAREQAREAKAQANTQAKLAQAEQALMAEIKRQEAKLSRAAIKTQKKAYYQAQWQKWQQSTLLQQQLPRLGRVASGVSILGFLAAGSIWIVQQIEWDSLSPRLVNEAPRFQQPADNSLAMLSQPQSMPERALAHAPAPTPNLTVADVPTPLPVDIGAAPDLATPAAPTAPEITAPPTPQPRTASAPTTATAEIMPTVPEPMVSNQPVTNAPVDEKPLPVEIQELRRNAVAGNRQAQHDLGAFYAAGRQIERDFVRAAYWFREAAMRGVPNAQYNLGVLLQRGLGVPQDTVMATQWYQSAARNNHPEAQYNLGVAYADGIGVEKNIRMAASWFEKAAVAGLPRAAFNLGVIHELGLNGQTDIDRAVRWYARASEAGERDAKESLDRLNIAEGDIAVLASELAQDLAHRYPVAAADQGQDQPLNSDQIAEVQGLLSRVGLYRGSADGQLGSKTVRAITQFQEKMGMTASGKATESLLAALRRQTGTDNTIN